MQPFMTHASSIDRQAFPLRFALIGGVALIAALSSTTRGDVVDAPGGFAVRSGGSVSVGGNATIFGSLGAAGSSSLGWGSNVTGVVENGSPHTWVTPDVGPLPAAGSQAINLGWRQTMALDPGAYAALSSNSEVNVLLDAGSYVFSSFQLGWNGRVTADTSAGDVTLYVTNGLSAADQSRFNVVGGGRLTLVTGGSASFGYQSQFNGSIYSLGAQSFANESQLNGFTWANGSISIGYGSTFTYSAPVPAPGALALLLTAVIGAPLRRRRS